MARSRVFSSIIHLQDLARKRQVPLPVLSTFRPHGPTPRMVGARERSDGQNGTKREKEFVSVVWVVLFGHEKGVCI